MNADPYQVLGVPRDATAEQIRQAYHDLARVWHPDRFGSDPRLQRFAEERLRDINSAYAFLRNRSVPEEPRAATNGEPRERGSERRGDEPRRPAANPAYSMPCATARPAARSWDTEFLQLVRRVPSRKLLRHAAIAVTALISFGAVLQMAPLVRTPTLDVDLIAGRARISRPQILAPARILDPALDVKVAADTLTEWARGEVLDLWKPESWNGMGARGKVVRSVPQGYDQSPAVKQRHLKPRASSPAAVFANGTELIAAGRLSGAGELRIVNNTELEEVATLMRRNTAVRAIYIGPNSEAMLRSIETGIYDVHLELGRNLDLRRLRFEEAGFSPEPVGPFQFFSLTTANGTTGLRYEVVVNPPTGKTTPE